MIVTRNKTYIFNGRRHSGTTAVFFGAATSTRSVLTAGQLVAVGHRREGGRGMGMCPENAKVTRRVHRRHCLRPISVGFFDF